MCGDGGGASNAYHHIHAGTGPRDEMGIRQKNSTKAKLFLRNCCQADLTFHEDSFFLCRVLEQGIAQPADYYYFLYHREAV